MELAALMNQRATLVKGMRQRLEAAAKESRDLTQAEIEQDDADAKALEGVNAAIARIERVLAAEATMTPVATSKMGVPGTIRQRGDSFPQAFGEWMRTGDRQALDSMETGRDKKTGLESVTINAAATDMNITTPADGGDLVPTGFYSQIIARRAEGMLTGKLPVTKIPGSGTTVDVPIDDSSSGVFVSTAETVDFDLDSPPVDKISLTLGKYTKFFPVSYELLEDSGIALMDFISDYVARGMARTHNNLLLAAVAAGGTALRTFSSATAIAFGEPELMVGNDALSPYLEDDNAAAFVTRSSTMWGLRSLTGNDRHYGSNMDKDNRTLLGYPVHYSQAASAPAATARSLYFGNWRYVVYREAPQLTFLRDPFTLAGKGQVRLLWYFRTVYGVTQADAIGYGQHPTA